MARRRAFGPLILPIAHTIRARFAILAPLYQQPWPPGTGKPGLRSCSA